MGSNPRSTLYKPQVLQRYEVPKTLGGRKSAFIIKQLRDLLKSGKLTPHRHFMALVLLMYCQGVIDFIHVNEVRTRETTKDDYGDREPDFLSGRSGVLNVNHQFKELLKHVNPDNNYLPDEETE